MRLFKPHENYKPIKSTRPAAVPSNYSRHRAKRVDCLDAYAHLDAGVSGDISFKDFSDLVKGKI
jgi:hypothetical protein